MINIKKLKLARFTKGLLVICLLQFLFLGLINSKGFATTEDLCFNLNAGTVSTCTTTTLKIDGSTSASFDKTKCYILNDIDTGWVSTDCTNSVFSTPTTKPIAATGDSATTACNGSQTTCLSIFTKDINPIVSFLAAGVGIVATIMIVVGAIQFSAAGGNPQAAAAAKKRIANAVIAIVVFGLMYGLLQWIVPGGIFNG